MRSRRPSALRRLLLFVSVVVFADTAFFAAITPLLPGLSDEFGLSKTQAGVLAAAYPAGTLLGSLPSGLLAARLGVRRTVLSGLALMIAASVGVAVAPGIALLDASRFAQGLGSAATWAGAFGWLVSAAPRERRGEVIGSALAAALVGALLGPVVGALASWLGRGPVFLVIAAGGAGLVAWALRMAPVAAEGGTLRSLARAARDPRVATGMWLVMLPGLLFGALAVLAPLRLDDLGAGAVVISAAWIAAGALEASVSPLAGRLADRRGRYLPATVGVGASAVIVALLPWPRAIGPLVALIVLASPALGLLWAPAMALLSDGAEHHAIAQGLAFALMNLAWATGETLGSAGGGRLADATSDAVPYLILAALCAASLALLRSLARRAAPTPV